MTALYIRRWITSLLSSWLLNTLGNSTGISHVIRKCAPDVILQLCSEFHLLLIILHSYKCLWSPRHESIRVCQGGWGICSDWTLEEAVNTGSVKQHTMGALRQRLFRTAVEGLPVWATCSYITSCRRRASWVMYETSQISDFIACSLQLPIFNMFM